MAADVAADVADGVAAVGAVAASVCSRFAAAWCSCRVAVVHSFRRRAVACRVAATAG